VNSVHSSILKKRFVTFIKQFFMVSLGLFMLLPLLWVTFNAFKLESDINRYPPVFFPDEMTLEHFQYAFTSQNLFRFVGNSFVIATGVVLVGCSVAALCAYAFSRYKFRGKGIFIGVVLFPMLIPGICNLIPIYSVYANFGLLNNYPALIALYIPGLLPSPSGCCAITLTACPSRWKRRR